MEGDEKEGWCQRQELNLRPKAYESSALPLSYSGNRGAFYLVQGAGAVKRNRVIDEEG